MLDIAVFLVRFTFVVFSTLLILNSFCIKKVMLKDDFFVVKPLTKNKFIYKIYAVIITSIGQTMYPT